MDKISVRITTLKSTPGNVGTAQIVGPGTPEGSTGLHTRLGLGGVSPADPTPAVVGTQITGQVLQLQVDQRANVS